MRCELSLESWSRILKVGGKWSGSARIFGWPVVTSWQNTLFEKKWVEEIILLIRESAL